MSNRKQNTSPPGGDPGATGGDALLFNSIVSQPSPHVKTIPAETGDALHWGICDALTTFRLALETAGIIPANNDAVLDCQFDAWRSMATASYLTDREPWADHLPELLKEMETPQ